VSVAELKPPSVLDTDNAAKVIEPYTNSLNTFDRYLAMAWNEVEVGNEAEEEEAAIGVARQVSQEFPDLNPALRAAAKLPAYQLRLDFTTDPSSLMEQMVDAKVQPRTIVRALNGHGLMSLADGNAGDAVEDAIAILNWSRHVADQPLLINHLVSVACYGQGIQLAARCLTAGDVTREDREALLKSLSSESMMRRRYAVTFNTERAFGISSFALFPGSRFKFMLGELASFLDILAEFESSAEQSTGLAADQPTKQGLFGGLTWSAQRQGFNAFRRKQALTRSLRILAAWQDAGRDPEVVLADLRLADLGLAESVTTDPYDGSQIKLKVSGESMVIYCVGENMIDDGGSVTDRRDIGIE
jgi:hypothetical protein